MDIRLNSYISQTNVEGPGTRFCLWVQGCSIRCKGCANSHMWNPDKGNLYNTDEIVELIKANKEKIEGITFLGGEPLDQVDAVINISQATQKMGLTVVVFSGYKFDQIEKMTKFNDLKDCIDILIDGRFEAENIDYSRPWVGSSNQKYYFLTDKYNENVFNNYANKIEIRIDNNNEISLNGMGDYKKVFDNLKELVR